MQNSQRMRLQVRSACSHYSDDYIKTRIQPTIFTEHCIRTLPIFVQPDLLFERKLSKLFTISVLCSSFNESTSVYRITQAQCHLTVAGVHRIFWKLHDQIEAINVVSEKILNCINLPYVPKYLRIATNLIKIFTHTSITYPLLERSSKSLRIRRISPSLPARLLHEGIKESLHSFDMKNMYVPGLMSSTGVVQPNSGRRSAILTTCTRISCSAIEIDMFPLQVNPSFVFQFINCDIGHTSPLSYTNVQLYRTSAAQNGGSSVRCLSTMIAVF